MVCLSELSADSLAREASSVSWPLRSPARTRSTSQHVDAVINALAQQGKLAEAIEHYQQVLQIKPDHAEARANLLQAQRALEMGKEDAAHSR